MQPCLLLSAGGIESPTKFPKKEGLTGPQLSEEGDYFQEGGL